MRRTIPSALMAVMAAVALIPGFLRSQGIGTSIRAIGAIQPRMWADGQSIAVSYQGAIWTVPSTGGSLRRLTSDVGFDSNPAWSADGKRIAYLNARELRVIDAATGSPNLRPAGLQGSGELYFHPDGKRILGNFGQPSTLCWVDVDTGTLKPVLQPARFMSVFALSPDGTRIAYVMTQDVTGEQTGRHGPQADVWSMPSDGGDANKLLQFRSRIYDLWWGRDGLTLASDLGGAHNDLWTLPADDPSLARRLTSGQADEDGVDVRRRALDGLHRQSRRRDSSRPPRSRNGR